MEDTLLIRMDEADWKLGYCKDDPVRPHLPLAWRATEGSRYEEVQRGAPGPRQGN